jgi:hypothetical protein
MENIMIQDEPMNTVGGSYPQIEPYLFEMPALMPFEGQYPESFPGAPPPPFLAFADDDEDEDDDLDEDDNFDDMEDDFEDDFEDDDFEDDDDDFEDEDDDYDYEEDVDYDDFDE